MTKKKNKSTIPFNNITGIVLVVILLIGVVRYYNAETPSRLVARNYTTETAPLEKLRGVSAKDANLEAALSSYEEKDFATAESLFSKYLSKTPTDFDAYFLKGISLMETGAFDEAVTVFKTIRINSVNHYEDATWFLALTYLKKNQKDDAKLILKELIAANGNSKVEAAKKLLSEIS